jgi:hypothetical protein
MKKSRLLEIIREEISTALSEITMVDKKTDATEAGEIAKKEEKDLPTVQAAIKTAKTTGKPVAVAEEDLNEIPDFGGRFDKQVADKYGEEDTLEAAMEKVVNRTLSDRGISKADVSKMDKEGLKGLLKAIRQQISGKGQTSDVAQALKKQTEFDDSGSKLQDNQTNNAILKALGLKEPGQRGRKADPNKPEKPASTGKKGRPAGSGEKKAVRTPGDDGFDKVEYVNTNVEDIETTQAPAGDVEMEKAARGRDELTKQYRGVMDAYKKMKAEEGDKAALEYLKTKQNIVKAYKKAQEVNI